MKKIILASLFLTLFSTQALAENTTTIEQTPPIPGDFTNNPLRETITTDFHGNIGFGYDYNFGFAQLNNNRVGKYTTNYLILDDRFKNYVYIQNADLSLKVNMLKLLNLNVSGSLVSNGLNAEPLLNPSSYVDFNKFLQDRKRNIANLWQRYGIIQDLNFALKDDRVDGSLVIGQQIVPFGYRTNATNISSSVTNPTITPMAEYINFNLRGDNETPYQNSTLSNIRDIGISLNGSYTNFRFFAGLFNGSGTNTFDNNNEKDIFGRFDLMLPGLAEVGVSHWRGKHVGYKTIYETDPKRVDFEMYKTGFHGKLGNDNLYLLGELIFANDSWADKSEVGQLGWYLEGTFKAASILTATARYESFNDNNVMKNVSQSANYSMRRLTTSLTQGLGDSIKFREEYSHTWEDLYEKTGTSTFDSYDVFSINLGYTF